MTINEDRGKELVSAMAGRMATWGLVQGVPGPITSQGGVKKGIRS